MIRAWRMRRSIGPKVTLTEIARPLLGTLDVRTRSRDEDSHLRQDVGDVGFV